MICVPFVKRKVFRTAKKAVAARPENRKKAEAVRGLWTPPNQEGQRRIKGPVGPLASGPAFAHIIRGRIFPIRRTRVSIS